MAMPGIASHGPRLKAMGRPKALGSRRSGRAGEPAAGESLRASESLDDVPQDPRLPSYPPNGPSHRLRDLYGSLSARLGISLGQVIEELAPYLIGWRGYFGFRQTPRVLTNLEAWIRRRLRMYLWRQWRSGHNRFKELRRRSVPKLNAAVAAGSPTGHWCMSGHPAARQALRNRYFDSLGLPRLYVPAEA